jgi:hypothetical protein
MPTDLSNLELDEVSLVGKAATGKRFLIFKSTTKGKGGNTMMTAPAGATSTGAGEALVSKADIMDIVQKAIAPLQDENRQLRKALQKQTDVLRKKDYVDLAKSHLDELGTPEEGAEILKSLESLPSDARKFILKTLKQTNAMKKEAGRMLYKSIGSSRPAPGSVSAQFYSLVDARMNEIRKSGTAPKDKVVLKSLAMDAISQEYPDLARAVIAEERAAVVRRQMGVA